MKFKFSQLHNLIFIVAFFFMYRIFCSELAILYERSFVTRISCKP
jgi:hypothetical protein